MTNFVHLRTSSAYSVTESILTPKEIVELALKNNQSAVAVTDNCKTIGVIQHYLAAREKGLKPIIGVDIYIESDVTKFPGADLHKILLIATDNNSYKNLLSLVSRAWLENQSNEKPAIKQSWLSENPEIAKGLIALSGTFKNSEIALGTLEVIDAENKEEKKIKYQKLQNVYAFYKQIFNDNFYLEIQRYGYPREDEIIMAYLQSSKINNIPIVATNPIEFANKEDFIANEIKICDQNKNTLYDVSREDYCLPDQYFKSTQEMEELFKNLEFALTNTQVIAEKCNVDIELFHNYLPPYPINTNETEQEYFIRLTKEGFEKRMRHDFPNQEDYDKNYPSYLKRLNDEINCIIQMEFPGYFLIVQDFINWSKNNNIPVGPGRGSGAGSLVAYALGITEVDPIKYHLFFERFLNPERVSMPDFDIDFSQDHREKVLDYVRNKYGEEVVSQIITTINLKPKALLKAVGRVLNIPHGEIDTLCKTITNAESLNDKTTLRLLYEGDENTPRNEDFYNTINDNEILKEAYQYAKTMDTLPKSLGQHAAGVIITSKKLTEFASLLKTPSTPTVIQLDKKYAEMVGLVKFDFLGLKTLDLIANTVNDIYLKKNIEININNIDLNDSKVIQLFREGNTFGVFQFEGVGMQRTIKNIKPNVFEDIVATTALFRPGPMQSGMLDSFIKRKNGEEEISYPQADYQHECLKPILQNTYGLFVYQEQVMQAAQAMAGYTLGGADLLRRAMGKKDIKEMERQKQIFKEGAIKNGIDPNLAIKIFEIIEKFAGYGFNKSHSVSYTVLSMQTAFLKTYYPAIFMANVLNGKDKPADREKVIEDIKKQNINILSPNINYSYYKHTTNDNDEIIYGFIGLKSVTENLAKFIVSEREKNGLFTSFEDFYERCFEYIDKRSVEQLIKSGAFDDLHSNQNELLANVEQFNKLSLKRRKNIQSSNASLQSKLVGKTTKKKNAIDMKFSELEWIEKPETSLIEKVTYEYQSFGFNFKNNPLLGYVEHFDGLKALQTLEDFKDLDLNEGEKSRPILFGAVITNIRNHPKGKFLDIIGENKRENTMILNANEDLSNEIKSIQNEEGDIDYNENNTIEDITSNEESTNQQPKNSYSVFLTHEKYEKWKHFLKENNFIVIDGTVNKNKPDKVEKFGKNSLWVENILSKSQLEEKLINELNIILESNNGDRLLNILQKYTGKIPVTIWLPSKNNDEIYSARLPKEYFINGSEECLNELRTVFSDKAIKLSFKEKLLIERQNNFNNYSYSF